MRSESSPRISLLVGDVDVVGLRGDREDVGRDPFAELDDLSKDAELARPGTGDLALGDGRPDELGMRDEWHLALHRPLEDRRRDDEPIDLVRPLEDSIDPRVAQHALGRIFFDEPVASVNLDAFVCAVVDAPPSRIP